MIPCLKIYPQISKKFTVLLRGVFLVAMFFLLIVESPQAQTFGTGADGSVNISTTVHLSADMNYFNLYIYPSGVIQTHGYKIYVQETLINHGTITDSYSGGNGGPWGNGGDGGHFYNPHVYSTSGSPGVGGSGPSVAGGGQGGTGGGGGGGGGGAWDEDDYYSASGGNGGRGGTGGQGGGVVLIYAKTLRNHSSIHTDGFNGNNGTNGQTGNYRSYTENIFWSRDIAGGGGGGGGGGRGGDGGLVEITYAAFPLMGTIQSNGGSGGSSSPGGSSINTSYSSGSRSYSESGSTGGSPGGGHGGYSTAGSGSSGSGTFGSTGSTGSSGTVTLIPATLCYVDADSDGFGSVSDPGTWTTGSCGGGFSTNNLDCDDGNPSINPAASEIVGDGVDQDCDGFDACYVDSDGDGYGSNSVTTGIDLTCTAVGESPNNFDCNDAMASIYPGAPEVPDDGIDQDCNGSDAVTCIVDADQDGYGTSAGTIIIAYDGSCDAAQQESDNALDCNDAVASIYPGAPEVPDDGIDQDCNGSDAVTCIVDADQDGFGTDAGTTVIAGDGSCDAAQQESTNDTDCNDAVASIYPGAPEVPDDGIDQDCNGSDAVTCIVDADQDGFGTDAGTTVIAGDGSCDAAQQESTNDTDCDDSNPAINPGATEILDDGIDQDCDGSDATCCGMYTSGQTGNAECDIEGKRNLADITRLIDNVYISKVALCCPKNGNTDGDGLGKVNLADITRLIDHVYISKVETEPCT